MNYRHITPPADLLAKIMERISQEKQLRKTKKQLWMFAILAPLSLLAVIPIGRILYQELSQSGIPDLVGLIFLDTNGFMISWNDALFFFLESLPTMLIIEFLFATFLFLELLRLLAKNLSTMNHHYG